MFLCRFAAVIAAMYGVFRFSKHIEKKKKENAIATELHLHDDFIEGVGLVIEKGKDFGGISFGGNGNIQPVFGGSSSTWELRRFKLSYSQITNTDLSLDGNELKIYTATVIYTFYLLNAKTYHDEIFKHISA